MNRVSGASQGFMEQANSFDTGWVAATLLLVVVAFVLGYQLTKRRSKSNRRFY